MKNNVISKLIISILFLVFHTLGSTQVPTGLNCRNALDSFIEIKKEIELTSYLSRVSFYNFWDEGEMIVLNIEDYLEKLGEHEYLNTFSKYEDFLKNDYLEHIYQNAVQHSSVVLARDTQDSINANTFTKTTILLTGSGIRIEVRNPKIKPFPQLLKKRFYKGDNVTTLEDRSGFKGRGIAHKMLIDGLNKLPHGSYIEWIEEDEIIVKIFLNLKKD